MKATPTPKITRRHKFFGRCGQVKAYRQRSPVGRNQRAEDARCRTYSGADDFKLESVTLAALAAMGI